MANEAERPNDWDRIFADQGAAKPQYDTWLDAYRDYLDESKAIPVIDLGCGSGNDTLYLAERGYPVISCDYSSEALRRLQFFIPKPDTRHFNMLDGLPFADDAAQVLIADLSLHYFSWLETGRVVREIGRVLKRGGYLLCRVNSVRDRNHGAGQGERIEEHFYQVHGTRKRFFDQRDLLRLFDGWEVLALKEYEMHRYQAPKLLWEIALRNTKA
ncbi:methyltransferase family protein [Hydrogenispora ethanolica]|uniref:Methyltransferase family protein n=1 Tax=Hydrogenispora ethanolica TaxID=1082276 RepID=A0A4R1R8T8_HYDET|nr:class I SAM-dependent methyltransferase [Hydrogenispora ethanolica]TCL62081.1 methyltransferase family protein [Hydrogenispora ethanolica]